MAARKDGAPARAAPIRRARGTDADAAPAEAPAEMFDLGAFLPYLINRAGTRLAVAFAAAIAPHGVALQEWRVIAVLGARGPQRLSGLAGLASIDISTLSRLVGRMARRALVTRDRSNGDRREVRVALAAKGRRILRAIVPLARHYERTALAGFDAQGAGTLRVMLKQVYANLDRL